MKTFIGAEERVGKQKGALARSKNMGGTSPGKKEVPGDLGGLISKKP